MSGHDESEAKPSPLRRPRRRSLRVPVDDVPRPTQAEPAVDGRSTLLDTTAFDDDHRMTLLDAGQPSSEPASAGSTADAAELLQEIDAEEIEASALEEPEVEASAPEEPEVEVPALVEPEDEPEAEAEAPATGAVVEALERTVDEGRLAVETRSGDALASSAPTPGSNGATVADAPAREGDEPRAASPAVVVAPVLGVVVQRVVAVASPASRPPPPPEHQPEPETDASPDVTVEVDEDDEPELRLGEPDASELEDLDVDLDEPDTAVAQDDADPDAGSDPEMIATEPRDSDLELTQEEAEEVLELEEAQARAESEKRPSRPPPPPRSPQKAAKDVREPEPTTGRRKKLRRNWWEELFNDDYLRTVPIPEPKMVARQCDFIEQRFGLAPGATILDVGCGLGRHAVELTRRGYLVVGLDLSLPMLARAADEAQDSGFKINFLHADMREMNFEGAFDAVLCYNTTLGYFDDEGNKQAVERLYRALKPRGLLLLDVVNRDFVIRSQPNLVWFEGEGCVVMEESQMNYITSRLEVKRTVILDDGRQRDNVYSVRTYSLHELGQILHHQGFRVVEVSGWEAHPGVFFGGDSPKVIILAQRRPAGPPTPPTRTGAESGAESGVGEDTIGVEGRAEGTDAGQLAPPSADDIEAEELVEEDLETEG